MVRDRVKPEDRIAVFLRDQMCLAPVLDPSASGLCLGRLTLEHVTDASRKGKRATSDLAHMVTLCEKHAGLIMNKGEQWNTKRENRQRLRQYLWRTYDLLCQFPGCERKRSEQVGGKWFCEPCALALKTGVFI